MLQEIENPVAVLFLPTVKGDRTVRVFGRSGAFYKFEWSKKRGNLVRLYDNAATFQRDELDIRRNTQNPVPVCTYVQSPECAKAAVDAVGALIAERNKIAGHTKKQALEEIRDAVMAAIDELSGIESHPVAPTPDPVVPSRSEPQAERPPWQSLRDWMRDKMDHIRYARDYYGITVKDRNEMCRQIFAAQGPAPRMIREVDPLAPDGFQSPLETQRIEQERETAGQEA